MRKYARLKVSVEGDVTTIALSYPERRNAIGPVMVNELLWALDDARASKIVVLTGEGKAFCAGGDFSQMTGGADAEQLPHKGDYADLLLALANYERPIVAKVNGPAMGGGLGLVASCTFAVASRDATLGTPEINVGLFPMMIMAMLQRVVPRRKLTEMMLLGDKLTADDACAYGLVNKVVPAEELDRATQELVGRLLEKSPKATALGLSALAAQDDLDLETALPMLRGKLGEILGTEDAREGLMAFLEKRKPNWTGR
jgi:enoyl-CoA hydratase/carnithine racemase